MNEFTLDELITAYFDREFDVPSQNIRSTSSHKRKMKKIFARFAESKRKMYASTNTSPVEATSLELKRRLTPKQKIIVLIAAIIGALFLTGFIIKFISDSFSGIVYDDNTWVFPINTENCPKTIEEPYYLTIVPEGFEINEIETTPFGHLVIYSNDVTGEKLTFEQNVKKEFNTHLNTENHNLEEIKVNGFNGIVLDISENYSCLIWDSDKYIIRISGDFNKKEMVDLAKINNEKGFVIG